MFGIGTLINTGAVIIGGLIGVFLKKGIPERCRVVLMQACGVATIFIGSSGVLKYMMTINDGKLGTQGSMLLIFSLVIGGLIGALLDIETKLESFGEFLKRTFRTGNDSLFVEGFVTATLVICVGAMAIVGSIEDGLTGNFSTLTAKAILDLIIVMVFASTLGKGAIFSAIPIFFYQGAITCLARAFGNFISPSLIDEIAFVGSSLIFCVGINIGFGKKFAVGNLLPSMLIPAIYAGIRLVLHI